MDQQALHFTTVDELSEGTIHSLLKEAEKFKEGSFWEPSPQHPFIANLFYEPSTRTKMSFEVAQRRLGLQILDVDTDNSSVQKGESLYDTVRTLQAVGASAVVVRHPDNHFYENLRNISIPIINAGDGNGEHPSQCLLDLLTIVEEFKCFRNLNVAVIGDVYHSRVARSNVKVLKRLGANVMFAGPDHWLDISGLDCPQVSVDTAVAGADVVMLLRVQHERHNEIMEQKKKNDYHAQYGLTMEREKMMKPGGIIMHPGPFHRDVEIASSLIEGSYHSRIFRQMENGVYARMAILKYVFEQQRDKEFALEGALS
ncbi:aspartate carbamoyltransferase catalytic subunit [Geomicrobium halophilum]|uniref:Aspartate carbamoyltransferase n=1 Tax=Geomicrobium halophilum TaxID=549000 RepID=A0A841PNL3_9BACL|nr:aspartate carbamoyltransferase catalytic subunit [Geomicrobium halophilum]MBB6449364.1 aspartate carbamoyltransferase catalytic subunit [Geomicrobium halophilum]